MYFLIRNILEECSAEQCHDADSAFVAVLTPEQWASESENFDMGIDFAGALTGILLTLAVGHALGRHKSTSNNER